MTYLWSGMILLGIIYGIFTGNLKAVTEAAVSSSKDAVALCIAMAGITAMWSGLMKIGEMTGLVQELSRKMRPVMRFLFPRLNPDSKACKYISLNFLSNILGLGWAATPAGLKAMEELNKLEEERRTRKVPGQRSVPRGVAGNEMCTFLILNISSLQLIPVNIIAYRSQYGSVNPAGIVGPAIAATAVSTAVAVIFCKCMDNKGRIQ
ncbi:MAG: nucleoside recognition protein [Blautia sp.]|nr:nucleoside recognition protein [Blautia sp.]